MFLPFQQALLDRLGKSAYPFSLEVGSLAPPSVQLVPAKRYTGAPIGTSYDVRVHLGKLNCVAHILCPFPSSLAIYKYL